MNLSGPLADRVGARGPSLVGGAGMAVGAVVMGAAPDYPVLLVGAAIFGLGNGAMDVSMNALGVSVEQARGRSVMSRLHASFSIGSLVGALLVVVLGQLLVADVSPRWSLWSAALIVVLLLAALVTTTPQSPPRAGNGEGGSRGKVPAGRVAARRHGGLLRAHRGHRRRLVLPARHRRRRGEPELRCLGPGLRQRLHGGDPALSGTRWSSGWAARRWCAAVRPVRCSATCSPPSPAGCR